MKPKILIHANSPWVRTGYGVQCALLAERLKAEGYDVAVSSTYGQQGQIGTWRGIRVYPAGYEMNGNDVIHNHANHFFDGDPSAGWIITLLDVWCLVNPRLADFNVVAWTPVDHFPVPPDVPQFFTRTDAVPLAMSRYGETELTRAGLAPEFVPLAVDTKVYKPTRTIVIADQEVTGRKLVGVDERAFLVGMVAMNKDPNDRKGFNEAFRAFGQFWRDHNDAVLYCHADWPGFAGGQDLREMARHAGIPEHAIVFPDLYAYKFGFSEEQMAAVYSAFDVLLAPSHGEGFCVPLIEAQACGTPVIASDFTAQAELVGPGWLVTGQLLWDQPQHASYLMPYIEDIREKLERAYRADFASIMPLAVDFASGYDADRVFENYWKPFLAELEPAAPVDPKPHMDDVAVLVPVLNRPENVKPLVESFNKANDGTANLYFIADAADKAELDAIFEAGAQVLPATHGSTFAQKINAGTEQTAESFVFVTGDDVRFGERWIQEARLLSDRFDVIGTNDTTDAPKNPDVAAGRHADHFFIRRAYIDEQGASLDGPGVAAPESYRHWYTDKEIVELAKARGVFSPCLSSVVEHLHPGYDGEERDATYMVAVDAAEDDKATFMSRLPLIQMQRVSRVRV